MPYKRVVTGQRTATPEKRASSDVPMLSAADIYASIKHVNDNTYTRARIVGYGPQGGGKSRFGASCPNSVILQCSTNGEKSLRGGDCKTIDLCAAGLVHKEVIFDLVDMVSEAGYESLIADELPKLRRNFLAIVLKKESQDDLPTTLKWQTATIQQWGIVNDMMIETIDYIDKKFPGHVVFLSQEAAFQNEESDKVEGLKPYMSSDIGGAHKFLHRSMDYEVRLSYYTPDDEDGSGVQSVRYGMQCVPMGPYPAKFRVDVGNSPPDMIDDPTFDKFLEYADLDIPVKKGKKLARNT